MAVTVEQEVLRLEVPVDDLEGVEIGESGDHLRRVELGSLTAANTSHYQYLTVAYININI